MKLKNMNCERYILKLQDFNEYPSESTVSENSKVEQTFYKTNVMLVKVK